MRWLPVALLCGCIAPDLGPDTDREPDPWVEPDPDPDPDPDPEPARIEVVLDQLEPGWRVTTSRMAAHDAPTESTVIADGTAITLVGTSSDVFVATITDAAGTLIAQRAMASPCTMAASRQLNVPHEYATIQSAIEAASPGDTVKVAAGTYHEALKMRPGVCLLGAGAKHTTLDAQGQPSTLVDLSGAPGSVVSGFTFRGVVQDSGCAQPADPFQCSGNWYRAGIYLGGSSWQDPTHDAPPVIANNIFEDNDIGVMFYWRGVGVLRNNVFAGNRIGFVANHFQDRTLVANNVFVDNAELAIGNQAAYLDIVDNVIVGSETAIAFQYVQTGHIKCNVFWNNTANQSDVHLVAPRFAIGADGNVEAEPKLVGNGDYHLQPGSPAKDTGCHGSNAREADGTLPDIGAYGGPLAAWTQL